MSEWNWSAEKERAGNDIRDIKHADLRDMLYEERHEHYLLEKELEKTRAELDALKAAHAWINTSERMPDAADGSCCDVLAIIDGTAIVLSYTPDDSVHPWADEFSNIYRADEVTHWQPLPEPPK